MRRKLIAGIPGFLVVAIIAAPCFAEITVSGTAMPSGGQNTYSSPLTLETVCAAADRSLWTTTDPKQAGKWFSVGEYHDLGKYSADGVSFRRDYRKKDGTWQNGLEMAVREEGGQLHLKVRASVLNPDENHDREVQISFEILNEGNPVARENLGPFGMEEGDDKDVTATFALSPAALKSDPMTRLRITLTARRD